MTTANIKLIVLASIEKIVFYEATGLKITPEAQHLELNVHKHAGTEKKDGFYQKKSAPGSFFDPHTSPQDITYHEAANIIADNLEKKSPEYKELIILASPKLVGHIKKCLKSKTLERSRFISKDITNDHTIEHISKLVF